MKKICSTVFCLVALHVCFLAPSRAEDKKSDKVDISGEWKAEVEAGGMTGEPAFKFKQEGDKLTGVYNGQFGEQKVTGKIIGGKIDFEFSVDGNKISYAGEIKDDAIKGTVNYGDFVSGTWTAKRKIDITGAWTATVELVGQIGYPTFKFKQEGDKLTGDYKGYFGEQKVSGKITGDKIEFKLSDTAITYKGVIKGDTMGGTLKVDEETGTWTAKRDEEKK